MRVLVACEFSGIVREAFAKCGHDAWSCDLLPTEIPGNHIQDDVLKYLNDGWDLMIAHPPCTYLSNAGACHLFPKGELNIERFNLGEQAKHFFITLHNAPINKICIENPIPSRIFRLPKYTQIIHPYFFGDPYQKKTCLWLKDLKPLEFKTPVEKGESTRIPGNWYNKGGKERQKNRSRTFCGIANAMAEQWGGR